MSRYSDYAENDLVITIGMDFAVQFWVTDADGLPLAVNTPAKMAVRNNYGAILFETKDPVNDLTVNMLTDATLMVSPENGMIQVTAPRAMTATWPTGAFTYDVWGTVDQGAPAEDTGWADTFPNDQQLPLVGGRVFVNQRVTVMP